jgi:D-glycerate 3-kinase
MIPLDPPRLFIDACRALDLPCKLIESYDSIYAPTAKWIYAAKTTKTRPFVLGVNGAQGAGKSTFCALLKLVLNAAGMSCAILSIDDLYHTRTHRKHLGQGIHPLCSIRGVPGTHDIELGHQILEQLCTQSSDQTTRVPRFKKAADDRSPSSEWTAIIGPVDVILFEGWCVGARPLPPWTAPYNERERQDDPHGIWSQWSSDCLSLSYQKLFERLDALLMIKVPSMNSVRQSRWLQEQKLINQIKSERIESSTKGVMSHTQVIQYVALFERHTEYMFKEMPARADVLIHRNDAFEFVLTRLPNTNG